MPNVVGISFRQAKTTLESQGLSVGLPTYVPDMARDYVLKQLYRGREIRKGAEILKGSEIELVLGSGLSDEKIPAPDLIGNTLFEARETLTKYFLNFGVTIYDDNVSTNVDSLKAIIYRQRPEANTMLQLGASIDVWVTIGVKK